MIAHISHDPLPVRPPAFYPHDSHTLCLSEWLRVIQSGQVMTPHTPPPPDVTMMPAPGWGHITDISLTQADINSELRD